MKQNKAVEKKAQKSLSLQGIRNPCTRDTGAMLYQLSYEASLEAAGNKASYFFRCTPTRHAKLIGRSPTLLVD